LPTIEIRSGNIGKTSVANYFLLNFFVQFLVVSYLLNHYNKHLMFLNLNFETPTWPINTVSFHVYFVVSPRGQDPVKPGLSSFWNRFITSNINVIWLVNSSTYPFFNTKPFNRSLCFNLQRTHVCLSQIRVLLGTIIDGLYVLTLVRRNWE